jgi:ADP-heptose:LPS heptosyltransferase
VFERSLKALSAGLVLSQPPFPPPPPPTIHAADFALELVARAGVPVPPPTAGIVLNEAELALAQPFFMTHRVNPAIQPLVVVHPGSGSPAKRWPVENFARLIDTMEGELGVRTVIVTGYAEADVLVGLHSHLDTATPLVADNWPLLPTAALIARAAVFVGHDSGLTHLAAALGRPTVAIFGPTDPGIWQPRGERVTVVPMARTSAGSSAQETARNTSQSGGSALCRVLQAIEHWLSKDSTTRSPSDRSA